MNRKGVAWTQLFMIAFFFLLLLVALLLLFMQKERTVYAREQYDDDLAYEVTRTTLLGLLRQPVQVDLNGDGTKEDAMLADAIVRGVALDESILKDRMPQNAFYILTIDGQKYERYVASGFGPSPRETIVGDIFKDSAPVVTITIGTVPVTLQYGDDELLYTYVRHNSRYQNKQAKARDLVTDALDTQLAAEASS